MWMVEEEGVLGAFVGCCRSSRVALGGIGWHREVIGCRREILYF